MNSSPVRPFKCPVCSAPGDQTYKPFCSRRCADVDLGRWLTGSYAVAGDVEDEATQDAMRSPGRDGDET